MATERKQRIARNEASFRELNEQLEESVHRGRGEPDHAGFVCECGDADCEKLVRVPLSSYSAVREDELLFIVVPGHQAPRRRRWSVTAPATSSCASTTT